ncbi:hypothetical protein [Sphingomonas jatrophae]|uniref:Uncharacterized protein n=1 Tax=Sphingomonas jatrophae TaxID=1166337 RepID=A0A1I6K452_9SPHN|nr:hypothetical protein [Sphingomonas jatrophae]SFR85610.1 hypothetical protein SAMN05192580_1277 [Sphingomonas jatrophae]
MDEAAFDQGDDCAIAGSLHDHVRDVAGISAAAVLAAGLLQTVFVAAPALLPGEGLGLYVPGLRIISDRCDVPEAGAAGRVQRRGG